MSITSWAYFFSGKPVIINFLRSRHLLAQTISCSRCGIPMYEAIRTGISDGVRWWCMTCKTNKSIWEGSFFAKSRLPLDKWLLLL